MGKSGIFELPRRLRYACGKIAAQLATRMDFPSGSPDCLEITPSRGMPKKEEETACAT